MTSEATQTVHPAIAAVVQGMETNHYALGVALLELISACYPSPAVLNVLRPEPWSKLTPRQFVTKLTDTMSERMLQ